jgi:PD-(D/E)XK nuclease superfamily protein
MLKAHAARLGLDVRHLARPGNTAGPSRASASPCRSNLRRAGPLLAASWFALCGYEVAWPLEPCRYDLVVRRGEECHRIQVKTTTTKTGGSWAVRISSTGRKGVTVYSPDEVDQFFIIDGDLTCYLIPLSVVGGYQVINLRRYHAFVVPRTWSDSP